MKDNIVISLKNIRKTFRYFKKDFMVFYWLFTNKGYTKEFKVLKDISFDIKKGEVVGILGKNGAGKSTILKIISSIYFPTSGKVEVNGTITSLIELGAGFNKELTGRENIYFKGTLLGLSKKYIDDHIDEMLEFADIGEYIDMPLATYSSGMKARLGFALAVNADPDILIIDEVFAVGDKNFQKKSRAKTEELLKSGKTVLFVSHSEDLISEFCNRVIYLKDGQVAYDGEVKKGLGVYHADNLNLKKEPMISYVEHEIIDHETADKQLRVRLNYGIGAGNQVIINDDLKKYNFVPAMYLTKEKETTQYNFVDCIAEKISDEFVDLYFNLEEVVNTGKFTICFNHLDFKNSERFEQAVFIEQSINDENDDYEVKVTNIDDKLVLEVKANLLNNE